MNNINELDRIINRYENFGDTSYNTTPKEYLIKALSTLIQKEREEAVRGFRTWYNKSIEGVRIVQQGIELQVVISEQTIKDYLSQTKGGKE
jgi:hypothetical protein